MQNHSSISEIPQQQLTFFPQGLNAETHRDAMDIYQLLEFAQRIVAKLQKGEYTCDKSNLKSHRWWTGPVSEILSKMLGIVHHTSHFPPTSLHYRYLTLCNILMDLHLLSLSDEGSDEPLNFFICGFPKKAIILSKGKDHTLML